MSNAILTLDNVHAFYGKSHVLHGVNLNIAPGEIVALLGRNGVGRSTIGKAIMNLVRTEGHIAFRDERVDGLPTFEIAQKGIGYVPESRDVFPTLSVGQNLRLGQRRNPRQATPRWCVEDMYRLFPRLLEREHTPAGVLSGGEQQMLALCRSLLGDPDLIIIDEPTEGLAPMIVEQIGAFLGELKHQGISVLLIEQKLTIALDIAQRVYVVGHGNVVFEGTPLALQANAPVRKEWLEV